MTEALITAFLLGLLSSLHCGGMCGGISGALSLSLPSRVKERPAAMLGYQMLFNCGRIASYMLVGAIVGLLTLALPDAHLTQVLAYARVAVGVLMILLALQLLGIFNSLSRLEHLGTGLWRYLSPLTRRLLPARTPAHALALGMLWGWLPCGLVYTALAFSLTQPGIGASVAVMGTFGLGTLPALLLAGTGFFALLRKLPSSRITMGILLLILGAWTAYAPFAGGHNHNPEADHSPHHAPSLNEPAQPKADPQPHAHH